ncbi:hypothetical protein, partial [Cupriavidus sp. BIS7]|uniref:hypothetical protein n=1 Tax=Cupriavidus sp. BIS7 TaxID=1217718 RepID=UPI001ED96FAF
GPLAYTESGRACPGAVLAGATTAGQRARPEKLENAMAVIVIKDLPENMDLDREAMTAIIGGARVTGTYRWQSSHRRPSLTRLIQYPEGFPGASQAAGQEREAGTKRK